ncbi:MAG: hypothetical protein Q8P59_12280 [Dehalococcoidia bacterium]|nr:hypothetical protein [Dehalococcoidia bacterium]
MRRRYGLPSTRWGYFLLLLALFLLAFSLRSVLLDRQSLWGDEAYTLSLASRASWQGILDEVLAGDPYTPHTPLYYLALMPWLKLAGNSDYALRWFSVAFGLLAIPATYAVVRRLRPPNRVEVPLGPLRVVGYYFPRAVRQGDTSLLLLYWEAKLAPGENYSLIVRLGTGPEQKLPLLPTYPTSRWSKGEALVSRHLVKVPAAVLGRQPLSIGLAGHAGTQLLPLTWVEVAGIKRNYQEPSMQRVYKVSLDDRVELLGIDLEGSERGLDAPVLRPGGSLALAIYWKALREMATSYTVSVQLLDDQGRLVAQEDTLPLRGGRPTTGWLPGEVVRDKHLLRISESLPQGRYSLIAGMYDARTGRRLGPVGQDFLHLLDVIVQND